MLSSKEIVEIQWATYNSIAEEFSGNISDI